jgi:hypothetical protein
MANFGNITILKTTTLTALVILSIQHLLLPTLASVNCKQETPDYCLRTGACKC